MIAHARKAEVQAAERFDLRKAGAYDGLFVFDTYFGRELVC
jgi:hypothetical protein